MEEREPVPTGALNGGFIPGMTYKFTPPIETNCFMIGGRKWGRGRFSHGWCLGPEKDKENTFVFQGRKCGEKMTYYFHVEVGPGVCAEVVSES